MKYYTSVVKSNRKKVSRLDETDINVTMVWFAEEFEDDGKRFVVDHDVFREMEVGEIKELMMSPVVVDCKNTFDKGGGVVYLGIGKGD